jgi:DNA-directed RNA polymerase specialized sigma24 family protein
MKPTKKPIKKKAKSKKPNKKTYYVSPKKFLQNLKDYYETDDLIDELATSVYKIAVGLSYSPNFINYSYKDEMIGDAVVKMVAAVKNKKFRIDSPSNPFSYFTTIAYHAFINRIKKEKKYRETILDYQEQVYGNMAREEAIENKAPNKDYDKELYI